MQGTLAPLETHADEPLWFWRKDRKVLAGEMGSQKKTIRPVVGEALEVCVAEARPGPPFLPLALMLGLHLPRRGCTNKLLSGCLVKSMPRAPAQKRPPVGLHEMLALKSHHPKLSRQGLSAQCPCHYLSLEGGPGKPAPLGIPTRTTFWSLSP